MSLSVQPPVEAPTTQTLASAWVNLVGSEPVYQLDVFHRRNPYAQASVHIANICRELVGNEPVEAPGLPDFAALDFESESGSAQDRALKSSLVTGIDLVLGREAEGTIDKVRRSTYKRTARIAAAATRELQAPGAASMEYSQQVGLKKVRAANTILSLASIYPISDFATIGALPHQRYSESVFQNYSAVTLEKTPHDQAVTVKKFRFRCADQESKEHMDNLSKAHGAGVITLAVCCELERTADTCEENIAALAYMLSLHRNGGSAATDMGRLLAAHELVSDRLSAAS